MKVRVKLFAAAKELAGCDELVVELPSGATIAELRRRVAAEHPRLNQLLPHSLWSIDAAYAADDTSLMEQSQIALIPPVSGG